jgi:hypothetical protein
VAQEHIQVKVRAVVHHVPQVNTHPIQAQQALLHA